MLHWFADDVQALLFPPGEMNAIERLPNTTAASIRASLLAVTVEDICRTLFRHAIEQCHKAFGTSSGSISISIDCVTWSVAVSLSVDPKSLLSPKKMTAASSLPENEIDLLSHLGLLHIDCISSAGTTTCLWQDGRKTRSQAPSISLRTPPLSNPNASGRQVTISLRNFFSDMPVRRKFIASESPKKSHTDSLVRCVRELSLLVPHARIELRIRHASRNDGAAQAFKMLLTLPRAKDLVDRFGAAFGADSVKPESVRRVRAEHTFTSVKMNVDGFVCLSATADAPQIIFLQGRVWPGADMRGASHQSERDSAVFASLLSAFNLEWVDEPVQRQQRLGLLSPDFYKQVCRRMLAVLGAAVPDQCTLGSHAFALNITLSYMAEDEQAQALLDGVTTLTATSFQAAVLDAICSEQSVAALSASRKRKRSDRSNLAVESGANADVISLASSRPGTASLALDSYGRRVPAPEGLIELRDPMSGQPFYIDRRTGHSIAVGLTSMTWGDGSLSASARVSSTHRGKIVNRSNLTKGLTSSPSKQRAAANDDYASDDEFDDSSLDAALACLPSPSPAASIDELRQSRFFDSRRAYPSSSSNPVRSTRLGDTEENAQRLKTSELQRAITRSDLREATVLDQVDGKFILCASRTPLSDPILFCIDQHAADERYRLERLLEDYVDGCMTGTAAHVVPSPFTLGVSVKQLELVTETEAVKQKMEKLGWKVQRAVLIHAVLGHAQVDLSGIPYILRERVLTDRGRIKDQELLQSAFTNCLEEVAAPCAHPSTAFDDDADWLAMSLRIPTSLMEVVKNTACRSAIMFNDPLSKQASERVVRRLGECKFPFQCAHGRPSLVPLCEIRTSQQNHVRESSAGT